MPSLTRNQIIAAAAGTLEVLEALSQGDGPMTLAQLIAATGRPRGTVHRMVSTLVNTGFATHDAQTARYALTLKAWRIGSSAVRDLDLVERARPSLERLMRETGETVHVSVMEGADAIVYVAKLASPRSIGVQTRLGQRSPSWCTATGRAMLAYDDEAADLALAGPLRRLTAQTITDPQQIRAILQDVKQQGYAITKIENHPDMGGVAAPVRDQTGHVVASVGVAIPEYRMLDSLVQSVIPHVVRAGADISEAMGYVAR
ncbi:MAG: IclR family transcriptional regulator, partial [Gammaproteobacteria bacterium]|nr:IclR family transcriptional regulator [Gammaproteobacteria bacterium]MBU1443164.1 IclR family transcriptional regulator [Gammaproteobacteria bacterium]MBU2407187.1 IclR family transcriptional regulator [Gammaproteobacteria bacterium]